MGQYLPLLALLVLAIVVRGVSLLVSRLLAPRRPTPPSTRPTSAASCPRREPPERFPVRFYLVAMIFIVFDIEIIFLYPWAVDLPGPRRLRAGRDGDLRRRRVRVVRLPDRQRRARLGPGQAGPPRLADGVARAHRPRTTIRRVGLEGRERGATEP